jgi:hypothetical protein
MTKYELWAVNPSVHCTDCSYSIHFLASLMGPVKRKEPWRDSAKRVLQPRSESKTFGTRSRSANRSIVTLGRWTRVHYQRFPIAGLKCGGWRAFRRSAHRAKQSCPKLACSGSDLSLVTGHPHQEFWCSSVPCRESTSIRQNNGFFPYPFQFVIHQPSYYATLKPSATPAS